MSEYCPTCGGSGRVTAQKQAENMPYHKLLGILMYQQGLVDVEITVDELGAMPQDRTVVIGGHPDPDILRIRLMAESAANEIAKKVQER